VFEMRKQLEKPYLILADSRGHSEKVSLFKLENRCSVRLSYHRLKAVADGITVPPRIDKGKSHATPLRQRHLPVVFSEL